MKINDIEENKKEESKSAKSIDINKESDLEIEDYSDKASISSLRR